ncbi:MAG: hypothetical protein AAF630_16910 [Cyanobacteria bacterium P01_C01_bin.38]
MNYNIPDFLVGNFSINSSLPNQTELVDKVSPQESQALEELQQIKN